jgi:hypothetical protein
MPSSAAPFLSKTVVGFYPATPASLLSGTSTVANTAVGNYGMNVAASSTVKYGFQIPQMGQPASESFPPYEQYNQPKTKTLKQNYLTVYYSVAAVALTSISVGLYATYYSASGAVVTTLLTLAANGLATAVGSYAVQIPLKNLPTVPVPITLVVAELDVVTPSGSTAIVNGISVS